jgi:hypothetical protein
VNEPTSALEKLDRGLEAKKTSSQASFVLFSAVSLSLWAAQSAAYARLRGEDAHMQQPISHQASAQVVSPAAERDADIVDAILRLHDRLLTEQEELPPDARRILYENLWQLYG